MLRHAIRIEPPETAALPRERLLAMQDAGRRVLAAERALADAGSNVVAAVLEGTGPFYQWDHYPPGDVYDTHSHAQYYYHAHDPGPRESLWAEEHGHFHTFLRPLGFPAGIAPSPLAETPPCANVNDALSHLVAISIGHDGRAMRLFTTNRWVTGETWYAANDVKTLLPLFGVDKADPNPHVNAWIGGVLALFAPTVESLLDARDAAVAAFAARRGDANAYENRLLEVTSIVDISVDDQAAAVDRALG